MSFVHPAPTVKPLEKRLRMSCLHLMRADAARQSGDGLDPKTVEFGSRLFAFADENRVLPILGHVLQYVPTNSAMSGLWASSHRRAEKQIKVLMALLDQVAERLERRGIPLVALKNAGIARGIYPCAACCPMGDLDVLVEKSRFREAHEILRGLGFAFSDRSPGVGVDFEHALESGGGAEYVKEVDGVEVWVELQWRPIAGRWIRRDQEPDGAELITRSVPIEGTAVRLLSPVDNMIQVALHAAKHSYVRAPGLRLHTDVDRLAHYYTPDWAEVVAEAKRLEVRTAVYFALAIPKELFESPIPDGVLEELKPPDWKNSWITTWIRRAGLFDPDEKKFSRPGMMLFHALLYDDLSGLMASVCDTDKKSLSLRSSPRLARQAVHHLSDILTRYQP